MGMETVIRVYISSFYAYVLLKEARDFYIAWDKQLLDNGLM